MRCDIHTNNVEWEGKAQKERDREKQSVCVCVRIYVENYWCSLALVTVNIISATCEWQLITRLTCEFPNFIRYLAFAHSIQFSMRSLVLIAFVICNTQPYAYLKRNIINKEKILCFRNIKTDNKNWKMENLCRYHIDRTEEGRQRQSAKFEVCDTGHKNSTHAHNYSMFVRQQRIEQKWVRKRREKKKQPEKASERRICHTNIYLNDMCICSVRLNFTINKL